MPFNQTLISLSLVCWTVALPLVSLQGQAIASDVTAESSGTVPEKTSPIVPGTPPQVTPPTQNKVIATQLVLKLKERRVYAYQNDRVLASFPVAVGKKGWETPKGNFKVMQMIENPQWRNPWNGKVSPPGPKSPLGERWIGFWTNGKNYIGFHGTPGENVMGQAVSHGCVRMRNKDVKALYEFVQIGIPVVVQP
ncbi:L,D-transpeptidase [Aphanothece sacrum]|uniref:L,D-transpeptidase n=1 Tax=Aphanothece sacrum FPU1 TaxID=1920663 RepID=A0A401INN6_APHSA|nr:L,D-transpeptidase [Aphanothece sacrum]GBF82859.1 L,D-transpeptidase [Aphanothece sacrum FPU1]GBF86264.1 L,D-transpeptidase [Aphanothece sacrum FPU3]